MLIYASMSRFNFSICSCASELGGVKSWLNGFLGGEQRGVCQCIRVCMYACMRMCGCERACVRHPVSYKQGMMRRSQQTRSRTLRKCTKPEIGVDSLWIRLWFWYLMHHYSRNLSCQSVKWVITTGLCEETSVIKPQAYNGPAYWTRNVIPVM